MSQIPKKIMIIGTSGCGKSTLGHKLSELNGLEYLDLDDLFWLPNWTPRSDESFIALLQQKISSDNWIICGNYSRARQQIWERADMIIWLDLPLSTCLFRVLKRSLRRWIKQEPCCNGNVETLARLFGKDSILLWVWNTHSRRKRAYAEFFSSPSHHLIRLKNHKEINDFISSIEH